MRYNINQYNFFKYFWTHLHHLSNIVTEIPFTDIIVQLVNNFIRYVIEEIGKYTELKKREKYLFYVTGSGLSYLTKTHYLFYILETDRRLTNIYNRPRSTTPSDS